MSACNLQSHLEKSDLARPLWAQPDRDRCIPVGTMQPWTKPLTLAATEEREGRRGERKEREREMGRRVKREKERGGGGRKERGRREKRERERWG